jgi:hypothetical protein
VLERRVVLPKAMYFLAFRLERFELEQPPPAATAPAGSSDVGTSPADDAEAAPAAAGASAEDAIPVAGSVSSSAFSAEPPPRS